jgi:hypothetical protein
LNTWVWNRVGIEVVVLRRNVMAWIVSRHGYKRSQNMRKDGVILIVDGDERLAQV